MSLTGCGDVATQSKDGGWSPAGSSEHDSHEPPAADAAFPGFPRAEHIGQLSKQESADALTALNVPFPTGDIHALLAALSTLR